MHGDKQRRRVWEYCGERAVREFFKREREEDGEGEVALEDCCNVAGCAAGETLGAA